MRVYFGLQTTSIMTEVTIAIINYNYGRFLKQAIESAINQDTTSSFEVLLIDDGSTDESDDIASSYANRTNFRFSKTENKGFAASLNRVVSEAHGKYIFFLDADDYFSPTKIEALLPYLRSGSIYVSDSPFLVDEKGDPLYKGLWGCTSTVAVCREKLEPLLPVENELSFSALLRLGKGIALRDSYTYYRYHSNSMTNRKIPGKWNIYLSRVTHNLANKLLSISYENKGSTWDVSRKRLNSVAFFFRSQAFYNELEAHLELSENLKSYKKCLLMLYWSLRASGKISFFHLRMIAKTILGKPSFPK